ncbi:hypothetical protein CZ787_17820 [Halomonas citrativorans]|uniref:Uncharacterized protein n=1 Tax=Halomonas citrativorans TaxID=2742612 RepID=A0A1R4I500_9GAMM|nr:hypothetical protein [Halomonas citrativorans]MBE0404023.1 hypothetical protein [Halomonas citrativorans]SJN14971.1 hypothetical protein CZ787_17820 [Halomonas citrativorans]
MKLRNTLSLLLLTTLASTPAFALNAERAPTASGHAYAEPYKAVRKEGVLHIEVRFVTDYPGYSGEIIYEDIPLDRIDGQIYAEFGDQSFSLLREDGGVVAPDNLRLSFNYEPDKNPRVGTWKADFVAPMHDVNEVMLFMPNVAPIGPIVIRDR